MKSTAEKNNQEKKLITLEYANRFSFEGEMKAGPSECEI